MLIFSNYNQIENTYQWHNAYPHIHCKTRISKQKKKIMELPNDNLKPKYYKHFYINQVNHSTEVGN